MRETEIRVMAFRAKTKTEIRKMIKRAKNRGKYRLISEDWSIQYVAVTGHGIVHSNIECLAFFEKAKP